MSLGTYNHYDGMLVNRKPIPLEQMNDLKFTKRQQQGRRRAAGTLKAKALLKRLLKRVDVAPR